MDAIILSGGKGKRMESDLPKALVFARGKPIIDHQLKYLSGNVDKVVLALGYKAQDVINYTRSVKIIGRLNYSIETIPLGTAGALKRAFKKTSSKYVLAFNGDDLTDIPFSDLEKITKNTICVANPRLPFGLVEEHMGAAKFEEKPLLKDKWVSCGWYVFDRDDLKNLPDVGMLETDVFPKLSLKIYEHKGFWQPLNSPKQIDEFEKGYVPSVEDKKREKELFEKLNLSADSGSIGDKPLSESEVRRLVGGTDPGEK